MFRAMSFGRSARLRLNERDYQLPHKTSERRCCSTSQYSNAHTVTHNRSFEKIRAPREAINSPFGDVTRPYGARGRFSPALATTSPYQGDSHRTAATPRSEHETQAQNRPFLLDTHAQRVTSGGTTLLCLLYSQCEQAYPTLAIDLMEFDCGRAAPLFWSPSSKPCQLTGFRRHD